MNPVFLSSACSHSAVQKEQLPKLQQHDTSFCCNGQRSGSPKVVRSLMSNRAIGTVRLFGHWKASAADPKPEGPGWVGGSTCTLSRKILRQTIRLIRLQNSMLLLTSKFCMLTLCCTKRATAKATTTRHILLLQRATERFAEGCSFITVEPSHWNGSSLRALESLCRLKPRNQDSQQTNKQLCVVCKSSSHYGERGGRNTADSDFCTQSKSIWFPTKGLRPVALWATLL